MPSPLSCYLFYFSLYLLNTFYISVMPLLHAFSIFYLISIHPFNCTVHFSYNAIHILHLHSFLHYAPIHYTLDLFIYLFIYISNTFSSTNNYLYYSVYSILLYTLLYSLHLTSYLLFYNFMYSTT